jgi:4-hydroxy-tetrahydrodipicolinate reductase
VIDGAKGGIMSKHRVILWGPGGVGEHVLHYLAGQPDLELVGVRCYSQDKEGKDPAELIGQPPCGVAATRDVQALLALEAECVIFTPRSMLTDHSAADSPDKVLEDELVAILAAGKNVVSSTGSFMHWRHLTGGKASFDRINDACERGRVSAYFTGIDPGFTDCVLGATLASLSGEISQIRSWEMIDYSTYMHSETLAAMGFGRKPEDVPASTEPILASWAGSVHTLADACALVLDEVIFEGDVWISPETYTPVNGLTVAAGTVGAIRFSLSGVVNGQPRVQLNHVNRLGSHAAPDWPSVGDAGGYRIEVDGYPSIKGDFPFGLPGGTGDGLKDAMAMTAGRLVNSIDAVVAAAPGHLTPNDLPLIGPRHGMAPSRDRVAA